jgi:hypothetical protein
MVTPDRDAPAELAQAEAPDAESPTPGAEAPEEPALPASFFADLVHQPRCIREGVCDGCGRCEH